MSTQGHSPWERFCYASRSYTVPANVAQSVEGSEAYMLFQSCNKCCAAADLACLVKADLLHDSYTTHTVESCRIIKLACNVQAWAGS